VAVLLEQDVADLADRDDALPAERGVELREAQPLAVEVLFDEPAMADQDGRHVLDDPPGGLGAERHPRDQGVQGEDRRRAQEPAAERVVVPDEGVLHHVADDEEHDEVEGRHLPELTLAQDAKRRQQEAVDHHRSQQLLGDGDVGDPEVHGVLLRVTSWASMDARRRTPIVRDFRGRREARRPGPAAAPGATRAAR